MSHDGLLLLDKPADCTSHDVVQQARRALRQRKIGHCGTLDPSATGLLLLTVGRGTRLTRFLIRAPKVYEGEIRLGIETDTYDDDGKVVAEHAVEVADDQIGRTMASFEGDYAQLPPPYSAKKIGGRKYYELAREGQEVPRETVAVKIFEFRPTSSLEDDRFRFRLSCSSGTYARTLAHDLGQQLGVGGHLSGLVRTRVGNFELGSAASSEQLADCDQQPEKLGGAWIPFDSVPLPFPSIVTDARQERRIGHGQTVLVPRIEAREGDWIKLMNSREQFIAVGTVVEKIGDQQLGVIQPKIVFR